MKPEPSASDWKCDGWNEPAKTRRELDAQMTFRERLIWLEQMTAFARKLQNAPKTTPPAFAQRGVPAVAEEQATYRKSPGADPRQ
jgi:hypothetical protein